MAIPSWITLSKLSGAGNDTVTITAEENVSTVPRSGAITVKAGSISKVITVTQEGAGATKGKITFRYTGAQIPQEYVGYNLYIGDNVTPEFYADYGEIESITADTVVVNFDNMSQEGLETTLATINGDMIELDIMYFGISSSDDPTIDWDALLYVDESGGESYTSDNMAVIIQNAFNGTDETISALSLISPSDEIVCSWGVSAANLLLASITQETLSQAGLSEVDFEVYADIYPDGERYNDSSLLNIKIGEFTLGLADPYSLNQPVVVKTSTNSQFTWHKEWSTVDLCRFTIKGDFGNILTTLNKNLIVNGEIFTKHEDVQTVYFESLNGIPLQHTTTSQSIDISSNYPTLTFDTIA